LNLIEANKTQMKSIEINRNQMKPNQDN